MASAYIITARRPIRSPRVPAKKAPNRYPIIAELASTPVCWFVRPHSDETAGRMKAIIAPSMASKVYPSPPIHSRRQWNRLNGSRSMRLSVLRSMSARET